MTEFTEVRRLLGVAAHRFGNPMLEICEKVRREVVGTYSPSVMSVSRLTLYRHLDVRQRLVVDRLQRQAEFDGRVVFQNFSISKVTSRPWDNMMYPTWKFIELESLEDVMVTRVLADARQGHPLVVISATGSGKTLKLPFEIAKRLGGRVLVLEPSAALAYVAYRYARGKNMSVGLCIEGEIRGQNMQVMYSTVKDFLVMAVENFDYSVNYKFVQVDESHHTSGEFFAVVAELCTRKRVMFCLTTATDEHKEYRGAPTVTMEYGVPDLPFDSWDACTVNALSPNSLVDGTTLVFVDNSQTAYMLSAKVYASGVIAVALTVQDPLEKLYVIQKAMVLYNELKCKFVVVLDSNFREGFTFDALAVVDGGKRSVMVEEGSWGERQDYVSRASQKQAAGRLGRLGKSGKYYGIIVKECKYNTMDETVILRSWLTLLRLREYTLFHKGLNSLKSLPDPLCYNVVISILPPTLMLLLRDAVGTVPKKASGGFQVFTHPSAPVAVNGGEDWDKREWLDLEMEDGSVVKKPFFAHGDWEVLTDLVLVDGEYEVAKYGSVVRSTVSRVSLASRRAGRTFNMGVVSSGIPGGYPVRSVVGVPAVVELNSQLPVPLGSVFSNAVEPVQVERVQLSSRSESVFGVTGEVPVSSRVVPVSEVGLNMELLRSDVFSVVNSPVVEMERLNLSSPVDRDVSVVQPSSPNINLGVPSPPIRPESSVSVRNVTTGVTMATVHVATERAVNTTDVYKWSSFWAFATEEPTAVDFRCLRHVRKAKLPSNLTGNDLLGVQTSLARCHNYELRTLKHLLAVRMGADIERWNNSRKEEQIRELQTNLRAISSYLSGLDGRFEKPECVLTGKVLEVRSCDQFDECFGVKLYTIVDGESLVAYCTRKSGLFYTSAHTVLGKVLKLVEGGISVSLKFKYNLCLDVVVLYTESMEVSGVIGKADMYLQFTSFSVEVKCGFPIIVCGTDGNIEKCGVVVGSICLEGRGIWYNCVDITKVISWEDYFEVF